MIADFVPDLDLGGLFLAQDDGAVFVLGPLEKYVDFLAHLGFDIAVGVGELTNVDLTLGLVTDVHHDIVFFHGNNCTAGDLAFLNRLQGLFVQGFELLGGKIFLHIVDGVDVGLVFGQVVVVHVSFLVNSVWSVWG